MGWGVLHFVWRLLLACMLLTGGVMCYNSFVTISAPKVCEGPSMKWPPPTMVLSSPCKVARYPCIGELSWKYSFYDCKGKLAGVRFVGRAIFELHHKMWEVQLKLSKETCYACSRMCNNDIHGTLNISFKVFIINSHLSGWICPKPVTSKISYIKAKLTCMLHQTFYFTYYKDAPCSQPNMSCEHTLYMYIKNIYLWYML